MSAQAWPSSKSFRSSASVTGRWSRTARSRSFSAASSDSACANLIGAKYLRLEIVAPTGQRIERSFQTDARGKARASLLTRLTTERMMAASDEHARPPSAREDLRSCRSRGRDRRRTLRLRDRPSDGAAAGEPELRLGRPGAADALRRGARRRAPAPDADDGRGDQRPAEAAPDADDAHDRVPAPGVEGARPDRRVQ